MLLTLMLKGPYPSMVYWLVPGTTAPPLWFSDIPTEADFIALAALSFLL